MSSVSYIHIIHVYSMVRRLKIFLDESARARKKTLAAF